MSKSQTLQRRAKVRRFGCASLALAAAVAMASPAMAADQTATWDGQTGNWNDPARWSTAAFPNNNAITYDVVASTTLTGVLTMNVASVTIQKFDFAAGSGLGDQFTFSSSANVLNINEKFTWIKGQVTGGGTINALGGVDFTLVAGRPRLTALTLNIGAGSISTYDPAFGSTSVGRFEAAGGATINNAGEFRIVRDRSSSNSAHVVHWEKIGTAGAPILNNSGTFVKTGGTLDFEVRGFQVTNTGTVRSQSGTMRFVSVGTDGRLMNITGNTLTGGAWEAVGAVLSLDSNDSAGDAATAITTIGAGAAVRLIGAGSSITRGPAAVETNLATVAGELSITGGRDASTGALGATGLVNVGVGSQLNVGGAGIGLSGTGLANVDGTVVGSVDGVDDAVVLLDGTIQGNVTLADDALLTGNGTVTGSVENAGTVSPGSSAGELTVGDYTQSSFGSLLIELGGLTPITEHDVLTITGNALFGGILNVVLINDFEPVDEDSFVILSFSTENPGTFDVVNLPDLSEFGLDWDTSELYTLGQITVVPEPSVLSLLGLGSLLLLRRRRTA